MKHRKHIAALVAAALIIMAGCAAQRPQKAAATATAAAATAAAAMPAATSRHEASPLYRYLYIEATRQRLMANHSAALDLLTHCADIDAEAPEAIYDLALYSRAMRQDSLALARLERAAALDPTSTQYVEALASYYLDADNDSVALPYVEHLATLQPRRTDVLSRLVGLYGAAGRPVDAIATLNRIETLEGMMPQVSLRKYQLYKTMGRNDDAYAELEALCREYPHELNYRISIANELIDDGRTDEALAIFDEVRRLDPTNTTLLISTMLYLRKSGQDSLFHAMRDSVLFDAHTPSEIREDLLRDNINELMAADTSAATRAAVEHLFDSLGTAVATDPRLLHLRLSYIVTHDTNNDSTYLATLRQMVELEPTNKNALMLLFTAYNEKQEFALLEDLCRRAVVNLPGEITCHYFLGLTLYQQDKHEEALRAFLAGIVQNNGEASPNMVANLFSIVGDLYHELGQTHQAYAAYDSCLTYDADNAMCLNNYAYFLSLDNADLDRAEEMSFRSLRIDPDNATYLDTYAWILFMKERYAEAQRYIDRVCPPDSTDSCLLASTDISGVVLEHAGDIAAHTGNMAQAMRFWRLAQKAGGTGISALLPRKIRLKRYLR